jgi:hypothetical protein
MLTVTNSMHLSPSSEAAIFSANTRISQRFYGDPKVHYRVHKSLPVVPILSLISRVHTTLSYISKFRFNIILLPTSVPSCRIILYKG